MNGNDMSHGYIIRRTGGTHLSVERRELRSAEMATMRILPLGRHLRRKHGITLLQLRELHPFHTHEGHLVLYSTAIRKRMLRETLIGNFYRNL